MADRSAQKASFLSQIYQNLEAVDHVSHQLRQAHGTATLTRPASGGGTVGEIKLQHQFKIKMASTSTLPALINVLNGLMSKPETAEALLQDFDACAEMIEDFLPFGSAYHTKFALFLNRRRSSAKQKTSAPFIQFENLMPKETAAAEAPAAGPEAEEGFSLIDLDDLDQAPRQANAVPLLVFPPASTLSERLFPQDLNCKSQEENLNGNLIYHVTLRNRPEWSQGAAWHQVTLNDSPYFFQLNAFFLVYTAFNLPEQDEMLSETASWFDHLLNPEKSQQSVQLLQKMRAREGFSVRLQHRAAAARMGPDGPQADPAKQFDRDLQLRLRYLGRSQLRMRIQVELTGPERMPLGLIQHMLGLPVKTPTQRKIQREFGLALDTPTGAMAYTRLLKVLSQDFLKLPNLQSDSGVKTLL
ncbi:MAG: hypothetical protein ACAI44_16610 [Candidatus Sericytochromatia bacterium]